MKGNTEKEKIEPLTEEELKEINSREKNKRGRIIVSEKEYEQLCNMFFLDDENESNEYKMKKEHYNKWAKFHKTYETERLQNLHERHKSRGILDDYDRNHKAEYKDIVTKKRTIIKYLQSNSVDILHNIVNSILADDEFMEQKFALMAGQKLEFIGYLRFETNCYYYLGLEEKTYDKYIFGDYRKKKYFKELSDKLKKSNIDKCFRIFNDARRMILHYLAHMRHNEYAFQEEYMYAILYAKQNSPLEPLLDYDGRYSFINYKDYDYSKYYYYLRDNVMGKFIR